MATTPKRDLALDVLRVQQESIEVCILGASPIILNRLSEKAKRELLMPSGRKTAADRASSLKHDPIAEYRSSPYTVPSGPTLLVIPAAMPKAALGTAALDLPGASKSQIGRLVYVEGDWIPLYGIPKLLMSIVRSADMARTPDIRSRVIVPEWAATFKISFVSPMVREQAVANLLVAAGITAGVGDWRPEKGKGAFGRFEVVAADDPRFLTIVKAYGRKIQLAALATPEAYDQETAELLDWYQTTAKAKGFAPTSAINGHAAAEEVPA